MESDGDLQRVLLLYSQHAACQGLNHPLGVPVLPPRPAARGSELLQHHGALLQPPHSRTSPSAGFVAHHQHHLAAAALTRLPVASGTCWVPPARSHQDKALPSCLSHPPAFPACLLPSTMQLSTAPPSKLPLTCCSPSLSFLHPPRVPSPSSHSSPLSFSTLVH